MEPVPLLTEDSDVLWDEEDLGEGFLSEVTETATGIIDLSNQVKNFKEMMEESVRKQTLELQEREKDSDFKLSLEAELLTLVLEMQSKEVVAKIKEKQREVQVRTDKLEEKEKVLRSLDENVRERSDELEKREDEFQLKARDVEVKREELELKEKKVEEIMSELDAREREQSLFDETIKEKSSELKKREEQFKEIEVKMRSVEKELEEREEQLKGKEKEFEERSIQAESRKRSRNECESSLFAENDHRDEDPLLIHTGKRHKLTREHSHNDTDLDCELYGRRNTSTDLDGREVECIDDDEEEPEPYNCLDADFNNFNNTMSSFSVGQVWALYDPSDHMPRYYARIMRILQHQQRVQVTWLEPVEQPADESHKHKPVPIACGEFKYGDRTTRTHLMFSHLMLDHVKTTTGGNRKKNTITINPRKGETWALFRDWNSDSNWKQQKRPYSYDFVQVVSDFDIDRGIGVAYLGRVEGFTSVYGFAEQKKVLQTMIGADEMLRFSHRVPSFELKGDEKEGVPAGSFELDPAAIPRDYLEGLKVKEEVGLGRSSPCLSIVQV